MSQSASNAMTRVQTVNRLYQRIEKLLDIQFEYARNGDSLGVKHISEAIDALSSTIRNLE